MNTLRRFVCLLLLVFSPAFAMRGCSTGRDEKINIIKGPGTSNNSLMISFNQLCRGSAEGFLTEDFSADGFPAGSISLLVSEKEEDRLTLYSIDVKTSEKTFLKSLPYEPNHSIELSPSGRQALYNNFLININDSGSINLPDSGTRLLPTPSRPYIPVPEGFPPLPYYSFSQNGTLYFTDPIYYISKYYNRLVSGFLTSSSVKQGVSHFIQLGDVTPHSDSGNMPYTSDSGNGASPSGNAFSENDLKFLLRLSRINIPENITYMKDMLILEDELKILFTGYDSKTGLTPLFMADLYSPAFLTLCDNVSKWALSPDGKTTAFIEYPEDGRQFETLYTIDISGENKKMLLGLPSFSGINWSPTGEYIAYSGGEDSSARDIGIIKKDGKDNEFLTHGMSSIGEPHWSKDSSRIAFTSSKSSPSVYIITLNMATEAASYESEPMPLLKKEMSLWFERILARETANMLSSGEGT